MRDPNQGTHNTFKNLNPGKHYHSKRGDRKRELRAKANAAIAQGTTVLGLAF